DYVPRQYVGLFLTASRWRRHCRLGATCHTGRPATGGAVYPGGVSGCGRGTGAWHRARAPGHLAVGEPSNQWGGPRPRLAYLPCPGAAGCSIGSSDSATASSSSLWHSALLAMLGARCQSPGDRESGALRDRLAPRLGRHGRFGLPCAVRLDGPAPGVVPVGVCMGDTLQGLANSGTAIAVLYHDGKDSVWLRVDAEMPHLTDGAGGTGEEAGEGDREGEWGGHGPGGGCGGR